MDSFTLDLQRFRLKTEQQISQAVRKIVLDLHTSIVMRSPVDTGRFRANNSVSLHNLGKDATFEVDKEGTATISRGGQVLAHYELGDTLFIYNNVGYALALEYGHSKQKAPHGIYRISVQELVSNFAGGAA